ncbi:basic proline-rich protein-like [Neovison vison]|uniref:basic proline-rich protein-like n=1 Tax=Neovison vison TaxID=452646 RepID=UPI001CEFF42D|nr:basic proline-rich protein-like [Neogale vison]
MPAAATRAGQPSVRGSLSGRNAGKTGSTQHPPPGNGWASSVLLIKWQTGPNPPRLESDTCLSQDVNVLEKALHTDHRRPLAICVLLTVEFLDTRPWATDRVEKTRVTPPHLGLQTPDRACPAGRRDTAALGPQHGQATLCAANPKAAPPRRPPPRPVRSPLLAPRSVCRDPLCALPAPPNPSPKQPQRGQGRRGALQAPKSGRGTTVPIRSPSVADREQLTANGTSDVNRAGPGRLLRVPPRPPAGSGLRRARGTVRVRSPPHGTGRRGAPGARSRGHGVARAAGSQLPGARPARAQRTLSGAAVRGRSAPGPARRHRDPHPRPPHATPAGSCAPAPRQTPQRGSGSGSQRSAPPRPPHGRRPIAARRAPRPRPRPGPRPATPPPARAPPRGPARPSSGPRPRHRPKPQTEKFNKQRTEAGGGGGGAGASRGSAASPVPTLRRRPAAAGSAAGGEGRRQVSSAAGAGGRGRGGRSRSLPPPAEARLRRGRGAPPRADGSRDGGRGAGRAGGCARGPPPLLRAVGRRGVAWREPPPAAPAAPVGRSVLSRRVPAARVWGAGVPSAPTPSPAAALPALRAAAVPGGVSLGPGARWKLGAVGGRPVSGAGARREGSAGFGFPTEPRRPARLARGPLPAGDARARALFLQRCPSRFCNRSPLHLLRARLAAPAGGGPGGRGRPGGGSSPNAQGADARRRPGGEQSRDGGPPATAAPARSRHPLAGASSPGTSVRPVPRVYHGPRGREDTGSPARACARTAGDECCPLGPGRGLRGGPPPRD